MPSCRMCLEEVYRKKQSNGEYLCLGCQTQENEIKLKEELELAVYIVDTVLKQHGGLTDGSGNVFNLTETLERWKKLLSGL